MKPDLKYFVNNYSESRETAKNNYPKASEVPDFYKTKGYYRGEDSQKLKDFIYELKLEGHSLYHIAFLVDLKQSTVFMHYNNYRPNKL